MNILIRRASPKDAAAYARLMNDPAVYAGLMQMPHTDEDIWRARLTEQAVPGRADLPLVADLNGEVVGFVGMHPTGPALRRRHAMTLGIGVLGTAQGKGVGTALMAALCDYADNWAGVLRLELTVDTDNGTAMRLYRKFGFEVEGTLRAYAMRDGCLTDVYTMARFHPRPPAVPASAPNPAPG